MHFAEAMVWSVLEIPSHPAWVPPYDGRGQADHAAAPGPGRQRLLLPARRPAFRRHDVMVMLGVYLTHKLPQEAFCQNFNIKVVTASTVNSFIYLGDKGS